MTLKALQDLFQRHRSHATGLWKLESQGGRTLFLNEGDVVFATSGRPQDRLTALLVERGKLTQIQLDYAMANLKPGLSIGRNLIDMGYLTQRDLLEVAKLQVERITQQTLGIPDEVPTFEARALDANTVRLPLDTPQLLLNGLLELKDRESLLELIGPLNQVVLLEGRRHLALSLPLDLSKLPPLFDGTHTLLELGREVPAEPLRIALFALFLREMGWARLHELPPLDPRVLDQALSETPLPMSPPLPLPADPELPNLFAAIRDAERPTTNLDHLSRSLDEAMEPALAPAPSLPNPLPAPVMAEGHVHLPTPSFELPPLLDEEAPLASPEPQLTLEPDSLRLAAPPEPMDFPAKKSRGPLLMGLGALLGLLVFLGFWGWRRGQSTLPHPPAPAPKATTALPTPVPAPVPAPTPSQPVPATPPPDEPSPKPAPPTVPAVPSHPSDAAEAMRGGNLNDALRAGEAVAKRASTQWCVRLLLATQAETVQKAPGHFAAPHPPLFLLPFRFRDGRSATQILYGPFPSRTAAEAALKDLPPAFTAGKNRPLLFQVGDVPRSQGR